MKNINDIVNKVDFTSKTTTEPPLTPVDDKTKVMVNEIFKRLGGIFTAYKAAWPDNKTVNAAKEQYLLGFMENNITSLSRIKHAMKRARLESQHKPFIPTIGQFITWCTPSPEELGLPSVYKAFQEASRNAANSKYEEVEWTHAAVHHTAVETGYYKLSNKREDESFKLFERNYEITIKMLLNGEELRTIPKALPEKIETVTAGLGTSHLKDMLNKLR